MATSPFPINTGATVVNSVIDGVFKVCVVGAETAIFAEVPVLADPILDDITDGLVEYIANKIYQEFAQFATFEVIDFQKSGDLSDDKKALVALKAAQQAGDQGGINSALLAFAKARAALTVTGGAAPPGHL